MVDIVTTATYRVKTEGKEAVDALDASLDALAVTEDNVTVAQEKVTKATRTTAEGFERKRASLEPAIRAYRQYQSALEQVARYEADGIGTAQERARVIDLTTRKYIDQTLAVQRAALAQDQYNKTAQMRVQNELLKAQQVGPYRALSPAEIGGGADQAAYAYQLDLIRAKYNKAFEAQMQYDSALAQIVAEHKVAGLSAESLAKEIANLDAAHAKAIAAINGTAGAATRAGAAGKEMAAGAGLARHELINLGRQAQDVVVSLQGGQGLFTVALQQGSQIADVFVASKATVGDFAKQAAGWLGNFLTAGRLAFGGIAVSAGAATVALYSYLDAQQKVQMALLGAGRASGASISSINSVAALGSSTFGLSVSEARNLAAALAATGKVANDNILPIVKMGHDVAVAFGIDAKGATELLAKAFSDPAKGAEELNQRLGFLDASMQRQITNLTASGKLWEAQKVLLSGVHAGLSGVNDAVTTSTNFWTALGNKISNVWDVFGEGLSRATGLGLKRGLDEQIKVAQERLDSFQKDLETAKKWMQEAGVSAADSGYDAAIAGIQKWKAALDAATGSLKANANAAAEAQARQRSFGQEAAMRAALPEVAEMESLKNQAAQLQQGIEDTRQAIANLVPDEATGARLKQLTDVLEAFTKALGRADTAIQNYKTSYDRAIEQQGFQLQGLTAFSPSAKGQVARDEAYSRGLAQFNDSTKAATYAEKAREIAIKQVTVAISEQQRTQVLASQQAVQSAQLDIDLIGQSIGKQAELRANLQAQQQLYQQAAQNRTLVNGQLNAGDQATLDLIKLQNAELGKKKQLEAEAQAQSKASFDLQTVGLSGVELQIAQLNYQIYGKDHWKEYGDSATAQLMRVADATKQLNDATREAFSSLASGLASGKLGVDELTSAFGGLATKLASGTLNRLFDALGSGDFSKVFGSQDLASGAGAMSTVGSGLNGYKSGDPAMGAISGALAGAQFGPVGAVVGGLAGAIGGFLGKTDQLRQARAEWEKSAPAFQAFLTQMSTGAQGELSQTFAQMTTQVRTFIEQAQKAHDQASVDLATDAYNNKIWRDTAAFRQSFQGMLDAINEGFGPSSPFATGADNIKQVATQLKQFIDDIRISYANDPIAAAAGHKPLVAGGGEDQIEQATKAARDYLATLLGIAPTYSDMTTTILEMQGKAVQLQSALTDLGMSADDAANTIRMGVTAAMQQFADKFTADLTTRLNAAQDKSYLNDTANLLKQYQSDLDDARQLGVDQALVAAVFKAEAQKIVDDAGLIGDAFSDFTKQFPTLANVVTESSAALAQAADEQAAALKKQQDALNSSAKSITDYVNGLLVGAQSTLSPSQRLNAASAAYNTTLALAQSGDADAQSKISTDAENYRQAAQAMYGSAAGYQSVLNQITSQLLNLPAVQETTDPVVQATRDVLTAVQATTAAVNAMSSSLAAGIAANSPSLIASAFLNSGATGLTYAQFVAGFPAGLATDSKLQTLYTALDANKNGIVSQLELLQAALKPAIDSGNAAAIASALSTYFNKIDTNTSQSIDLAEMQSALAGMASVSALRDMFTRLDTDNSGSISRLDLIKAATDATSTATQNTYTATTTTNSLITASNTLQTSANTLSSAANSLLDSAKTWLNSINTLTSTQNGILQTSKDQLDLLNWQLGTSTNQSTLTKVIGPSDETSTIYTGWNTMNQALNKIVANTYATASNTFALVQINSSAKTLPHYTGALASGGWITGGVPGVDSVPLADGKTLGMPGEYVVRRDVAQANAAWLPQFNETGRLPESAALSMMPAQIAASPIVMQPQFTPQPIVMPSFAAPASAGNDNGDIRALRDEVRELRRTVATLLADGNRINADGHARTAGEVRQQTGEMNKQERRARIAMAGAAGRG